jgi:hypothetical protein
MFRFIFRLFHCGERSPSEPQIRPELFGEKNESLIAAVNERFLGRPERNVVAIPTAPSWLRFRKPVQTVFKIDDFYRCMQQAWSETLTYTKQLSIRTFRLEDSVGS